MVEAFCGVDVEKSVFVLSACWFAARSYCKHFLCLKKKGRLRLIATKGCALWYILGKQRESSHGHRQAGGGHTLCNQVTILL